MTATEGPIAAEILRLAREELGFTGDLPAADEPLSGRFDSLMLLSLVVAVEDRFHVALSDDDTAGVRTLADLARVVAGRGPSPGAMDVETRP